LRCSGVCLSAAARNGGGRREPTHTEAFNDHQDLLGRESGAHCSLSLGGLDGGEPAPIGLCAFAEGNGTQAPFEPRPVEESHLVGVLATAQGI
jgi:hypothetical protein